MLRSVLRFLSLFLILAIPVDGAAQGIDRLAGSWELDRAVSTFGPGDFGAGRLDIALSPQEVTVTKSDFQASIPPSVWILPLDGSSPPPPRIGSALPVDGTLVIKHERRREI